MAIVNPGYRGYVNIPSVGVVRYATGNIASKQTIRAEDIVMGDWDHDAYVYGPIDVSGSLSGPVTETFVAGTGVQSLLKWACSRDNCGKLSEDDSTIFYYCDSTTSSYRSKTFTALKANSIGFSCAAGDIAQFTLDVMAKEAGTWASTDPTLITTAEKFITWDRVTVVVSGVGPGSTELSATEVNFSNFDFTISNNLTPVYAIQQALGQTLYPVEIVEGLRTITGTLSVYNTPGWDAPDTWTDYEAADTSILTVTIGGQEVAFQVQFHRIEPTSSVGPITSSIGFTGVTHQTGDIWTR